MSHGSGRAPSGTICGAAPTRMRLFLFRRDRTPVCPLAQRLAIDADVLRNMHPRAGVEARRARRAIGVHAQADLAHAIRVLDAEEIMQQRKRKSLAAPVAPHANATDPASAREALAQHSCDDR